MTIELKLGSVIELLNGESVIIDTVKDGVYEAYSPWKGRVSYEKGGKPIGNSPAIERVIL